MRVLIADFDLFHITGGGQTFYRGVMKAFPDIEFHYLARAEAGSAPRPANAHPVAYREAYQWGGATWPEGEEWAGAICQAANVAASVAGQQFDVVDIPDYFPVGGFLPAALAHHGVRWGSMAVSMHGTISTPLGMNWKVTRTEEQLARMAEMEDMQYRVADVRYGISRAYLDEWAARVAAPSCYLDPFHFLSLPCPAASPPSASPPALLFLGRAEKRKGPDLFLDLAAWLPRDCYDSVSVVGPPWVEEPYHSDEYLRSIARDRDLDVRLVPGLKQSELFALLASKCVVFLPSRYDSLNLLALESLFAGCPTVVGSGAGVCRFLGEQLPRVPFIRCDVGEPLACLGEVLAVLRDYDAYRARLVEGVRATPREPRSPGLADIYRSAPAPVAGARDEMARRFRDMMPRLRPAPARGTSFLYRSPAPGWPEWRALPGAVPGALVRRAARLASPVTSRVRFARTIGRALALPERTDAEVEAKVKALASLSWQSRIGKVCFWKELARLERRRGNRLLGATYDLRVLRLQGRDCDNRLGGARADLAAQGYAPEAEAVSAMFGPGSPEEQAARCRALLDQAYRKHLDNPPRDFEHVDDRRGGAPCRVSVIVSLYKAAAKLGLFLRTLERQTLAAQGGMELVLVDSGSPTDEYAAFRQWAEGAALPVVYARSRQRETIQSAWNRGIALSRAPYLTFLGVDEAILPECLEALAKELDADPALDWVQANSLVTAVDVHGTLHEDVMLYDRRGYRPGLVYLETCYLSWVAALYRRSIHDRFGYYDASFTAAGDTEFKNRVLPHVKTGAVCRTLGIFRNYPEERTTAHPRAEIEDLRAWYLHRTAGGAAYAYDGRDVAEVEEQLYAALSYRKSYLKRLSSDVEYASQLGRYLRWRAPDSPALRLMPGVERLLRTYRALDALRPDRGTGNFLPLGLALSRMRAVRRQHWGLGREGWAPEYGYLNDNRQEQHFWAW